MTQEEKRARRIFLQFSLLIVLMAGVNLYLYFIEGNLMSLGVAVASAIAFIGWIFFYKRYVRAKEQ